jgi:hypothetical protein
MFKFKLATKTNITILLSIGIYALFLFFILQRTGIITINEAEKYISAADKVLSGDFLEVASEYPFYLSYILFISLFLFLCNIKTVVIAQVILSFIASTCVQKTLTLLKLNWLIALIGMLTFLLCYPIQIWSLTLFSDSFFISLITIIIYFTIKTKSKFELALWVFLNVILVFSRPPGTFLVLVFVMFHLHKVSILTVTRLYFTYALLFALLLISTFFVSTQSKGYIVPVAAGRVIVDSLDYTVAGFSSKPKNNLAAAYHYLFQEKGFGYLAVLYLRKSISFFTLTRPYYSFTHNMIVSFFYLLYPLCIIGLMSLWKSGRKDIVLLFLTCIFNLMNLVALTYNEWHYRFTSPMFPFLILGSTCALEFTLKKIKLIKTSATIKLPLIT